MDDTLYPLSLGINMACRKNIEGTCIRSCVSTYSLFNVILVGLFEFMMVDYPIHGLSYFRVHATSLAY